MATAATDIIVRPLITEKTTFLANAKNSYAFEVAPRASKPEIKKAVEELFKVKVTAVRTLNRKGKAKRTKTGYVDLPTKKRAIVTLAEDSKIDLF